MNMRVSRRRPRCTQPVACLVNHRSVPSSSVAASSQSLDPQPALERTKNDPSSTADAATYTLERSSCFTSHPHVTSCVLAEVSRNAQGREVTVALKTTVHLTESDAYVQLSDLEELGWLATRVRVLSEVPQTAACMRLRIVGFLG